MKNEIRNRLLNVEITPPRDAWQAIAQQLDEFSADAPVAAKLSDLAIDPPKGAWANIERALDSAPEYAFANRLASYETAAPPATWQKIVAALDAAVTTPVITLQSRKTAFWKYAAAAAVIGLIAISSVWLSNQSRTNNGNNMASGKEITPVQQKNNSPVTNPFRTNTEPENRKFTQTEDEKAGRMMATADYNEIRKKIRNAYGPGIDQPENTPVALANSFTVDDMEERVQPIRYAANDIAYNPSRIANDNSYITYIGNDGSPVRVSKKLSGLINCINNENTLGNKECKEQVQQWREKIARSPITPSPNNFLDFVDLIKTLQEN